MKVIYYTSVVLMLLLNGVYIFEYICMHLYYSLCCWQRCSDAVCYPGSVEECRSSYRSLVCSHTLHFHTDCPPYIHHHLRHMCRVHAYTKYITVTDCSIYNAGPAQQHTYLYLYIYETWHISGAVDKEMLHLFLVNL